MTNNNLFSPTELSLLQDSDILRTKRRVQNKISILLEQVKHSIEIELNHSSQAFPIDKFSAGKISIGENYKGLAYHVLDYPARFSKEDILACRTMFLWGSFFSVTLHIQGSYLNKNRRNLFDLASSLSGNDIYISNNTTPWHYLYTPDNYVPLDLASSRKILESNFIKISKRIALDNFASLPTVATEFYSYLLKNFAN